MSIQKVFVRSAYNYDRDLASDEAALCCEDPHLTVQDSAEDFDPNVVIDRVKRGIDVSVSLSARQPIYGDFTEAKSRHELMNEIAASNSIFYLLPETTRKQFNHDPSAFRNWAAADENIDKLVEFGLVEKVEPSQPVEPLAPVVAPAPAGGAKEGE